MKKNLSGITEKKSLKKKSDYFKQLCTEEICEYFSTNNAAFKNLSKLNGLIHKEPSIEMKVVKYDFLLEGLLNIFKELEDSKMRFPKVDHQLFFLIAYQNEKNYLNL